MLKFKYYFIGIIAIGVGYGIGLVAQDFFGIMYSPIICALIMAYMWFKDGYQGWLNEAGYTKKGEHQNDQNK